MRKQLFDYGAVFDRLGYPLRQSHALSPDVLTAMERRLGVEVPSALREYALIAGNEKRFNRAFQQFLHPKQWSIVKKHVVFLVENQGVCCWGVSVKTKNARDPSVSQGTGKNLQVEWHKEHDRCSTFLKVILHYQAVSGGYEYLGSATPPDNLHELLKGSWTFVGEVNQLWAFHRQNQVICVMANNSVPFMPAMTLLAGGKTRKDLQSIEQSLSLPLR